MMLRVATLQRVEPGQAWVEIPSVARGETWGPCRIMEGLGSSDIGGLAVTVGAGGAPSHSHASSVTANPWTAGDQVLVGSLGSSQDEWVVIGRLE
jgi:hypothetical protein